MTHQICKDGKIVDADAIVFCSLLKCYQAVRSGDAEVSEGGLKLNSSISEDEIRICDECGGLVYTHSEHEDWWGDCYFAKCHKCGKFIPGGYSLRSLRRKTNKLKKASKLSEEELATIINDSKIDNSATNS